MERQKHKGTFLMPKGMRQDLTNVKKDMAADERLKKKLEAKKKVKK